MVLILDQVGISIEMLFAFGKLVTINRISGSQIPLSWDIVIIHEHGIRLFVDFHGKRTRRSICCPADDYQNIFIDHCGKFGGSLNSEGGFRFFTGNREAKTSDFIHFNFQI